MVAWQIFFFPPWKFPDCFSVFLRGRLRKYTKCLKTVKRIITNCLFHVSFFPPSALLPHEPKFRMVGSFFFYSPPSLSTAFHSLSQRLWIVSSAKINARYRVHQNEKTVFPGWEVALIQNFPMIFRLGCTICLGILAKALKYILGRGNSPLTSFNKISKRSSSVDKRVCWVVMELCWHMSSLRTSYSWRWYFDKVYICSLIEYLQKRFEPSAKLFQSMFALLVLFFPASAGAMHKLLISVNSVNTVNCVIAGGECMMCALVHVACSSKYCSKMLPAKRIQWVTQQLWFWKCDKRSLLPFTDGASLSQ